MGLNTYKKTSKKYIPIKSTHLYSTNQEDNHPNFFSKKKPALNKTGYKGRYCVTTIYSFR